MTEVTIEMYRGVDPNDGVVSMFALDAEKNRVAVKTSHRVKDNWESAEGFEGPRAWSYVNCAFYLGEETIRKMEHLWTHTFTVED